MPCIVCFHPIVAALIICYWLPGIGVPLVVIALVYYVVSGYINQRSIHEKNKHEGGAGNN